MTEIFARERQADWFAGHGPSCPNCPPCYPQDLWTTPRSANPPVALIHRRGRARIIRQTTGCRVPQGRASLRCAGLLCRPRSAAMDICPHPLRVAQRRKICPSCRRAWSGTTLLGAGHSFAHNLESEPYFVPRAIGLGSASAIFLRVLASVWWKTWSVPATFSTVSCS
jgi:hypothetical protein